MSPPLRAKENQEKVFQFLVDHQSKGIQVVATDHCPFFMKDKELGKDDFRKTPNGGPGVGERLILLFSELVQKNKMPLTEFIKLVSENPAKIFNLYPKKGVIALGADADLVVIDPNQDNQITLENLHMKGDYALYENFPVKGKIEKVFLKGEMVKDNNEFIPPKVKGEYLKRS